MANMASVAYAIEGPKETLQKINEAIVVAIHTDDNRYELYKAAEYLKLPINDNTHLGGEISEESEDEEEKKEIIIEEDNIEYDWEKEYKEQESKKNIKDIFSNGYNYYKILGLEDKFLNSKDEDFRKAYKKLALIYHPDKNKENKSLQGVSDEQIREEIQKDLEKENKLGNENNDHEDENNDNKDESNKKKKN